MQSICLLASFWDSLPIHLPTPVALAAVAVLGYLMGRRRVPPPDETPGSQARRELKRAQAVAKELERIAEQVRRELAAHHASVVRFKERLFSIGTAQTDVAWQDLCREAEELLRPTLALAVQLSNAYDQIRQQSSHLMTFTESRTDPLTGVSNRRALDETLAAQFALLHRYQSPFAVAILDIDRFQQVNDEQGRPHGDSLLKRVARLLDEGVRDTDIVTRYGGEEFVIVMPHATLAEAARFSERLRQRVADELPLSLSVGVAAAAESDTAQALIARADAALYSAKAAGRARVFCHDGLAIHAGADLEDAPPPRAAAQHSA